MQSSLQWWKVPWGHVGWREGWEVWIAKGQEHTSGMRGAFTIFEVVMHSWVQTYIKTYPVVHFIYINPLQ